ncbi:hypothetical protein [Catellatospora chokoriensis]|uniref:Uncharacterized protein n=1 Tax=Catellatospora chokoriensis TaxID=310353 RepID=A0A8J3JWK6_9ACTN|nr:hypothetical protein [Catellatospora chokoriensis]GIF89804.1 hypothetical protein Cch02nite_32480 [Catellatospora chokoriensis]
MPTPTTRTVIVCISASLQEPDWFTASEIVADKLGTAGVPTQRYRVRHRRIVGLVTRWMTGRLVNATRRFGVVRTATGGRLSRLDLSGLALAAAAHAHARWLAWDFHIRRTTPQAKPWEHYLALQRKDPKKLTLTDAKRQFEEQPRVVAMIGLSDHRTAPHQFDPDELAAYQAGQHAYTAMSWQQAIAGHVLITAEGQVLKPASDSMADRLRYLQQASQYVHAMKADQYLVALNVD